MAVYSDPLMAYILMDFEAFEIHPDHFEVREKSEDKRFLTFGETEAAAWKASVDHIRVGQRDIDIKARLKITAMMILIAGYPKRDMRGKDIDPTEIYKRAKLAAYLKQQDWKDAVQTARDIMAAEFAPCEDQQED